MGVRHQERSCKRSVMFWWGARWTNFPWEQWTTFQQCTCDIIIKRLVFRVFLGCDEVNGNLWIIKILFSIRSMVHVRINVPSQAWNKVMKNWVVLQGSSGAGVTFDRSFSNRIVISAPMQNSSWMKSNTWPKNLLIECKQHNYDWLIRSHAILEYWREKEGKVGVYTEVRCCGHSSPGPSAFEPAEISRKRKWKNVNVEKLSWRKGKTNFENLEGLWTNASMPCDMNE